MAPTTRTGTLDRLVAPAPLLAGAVLAFVACCVLGRVLSRLNQYKYFTRFHFALDPRSQFYPTASQVLALARARFQPNKVAVIVGGNSVLNGIGQLPGRLWTRELQNLLGDGYTVLNLGMPAAHPYEFGEVVAEMLATDQKKLIYVTDVGISMCLGDPDGYLYRYFYWDAYFKGLLPSAPEREACLAAQEADRQAKGNDGIRELIQGRRLDSLLFFQDLWTTCGLKSFSTIWGPVLGGYATTPRQDILDWGEQWRPPEKRYPPAEDAPNLQLVRGYLGGLGGQVFSMPLPPGARPKGLSVTAAASPLAQTFRDCFPEPFRSRSVVLVLSESPYYVDRLENAVKGDYRWRLERAAEVLEGAGFAALAVGNDFTADDFSDRLHLSDEGGRKLAHKVAPKVRALAARLGYLEEGGKP